MNLHGCVCARDGWNLVDSNREGLGFGRGSTIEGLQYVGEDEAPYQEEFEYDGEGLE